MARHILLSRGSFILLFGGVLACVSDEQACPQDVCAAVAGRAGASAGGSGVMAGAGGAASSSTLAGVIEAGIGFSFGSLDATVAAAPQQLQSVAAREGEFLAVLGDLRAPGLHSYAVRVSGDGRVVDPQGVDLGRASGVKVREAGAGYLAAWLECSSAADVSCDLRVATLRDEDGLWGPRARSVLSGVDAADFFFERIGNHYALVWQPVSRAGAGGGCGGPSVAPEPTLIALLDQGGDITQQPRVIEGFEGNLLAMAASPTSAVLVAGKNLDTTVSELTAYQLVIDPAPKVGPARSLGAFPWFGRLHLAYGAHQFLLVSGLYLKALRLSEQGQPLDAEPIVLDTQSASGAFVADLGFAGGAFRVSRRLGPLFGEWSISPSGDVTLEVVPEPWTSQRMWVEHGETWALFGVSADHARVGYAVDHPEAATQLSPLTSHAPSQRSFSFGRAGSTAAAWLEAVGDDVQVWSAGGSALGDGAPAFSRRIATLPATGALVSPQIEVGPQGGVVVWIDPSTQHLTTTIKALRLDVQGVPLDPEPLLIASESVVDMGNTFSDANHLAIAPTDGGWSLVHGFSWGNASASNQLCLIDLTAGGAVTPRGCRVGVRPTIVAVEGGHVIAWQAYGAPSLLVHRIAHGERLAQVVFDSKGLAAGSVDGTLGFSRAPWGPVAAMATDGRRVLVTWADPSGKNGDGLASARAALIDASTMTTLKQPFALSGDLEVSDVAAAYDGQSYWVAWRDGVSKGRLRAARLDDQGRVLVPAADLLDVERAWPGLSLSASNGAVLLAHTPLVEAVGSPRIELRRLNVVSP